MDIAMQRQAYFDVEAEPLKDTAGKPHANATPSAGFGYAAPLRRLILASGVAVLMVIVMVKEGGYGGERQFDEPGLDTISLSEGMEPWEAALEVSGKIGDVLLEALKDIGNQMKQARQELQAMAEKKMSIAEDKLEQFTEKMARTTAMLVEMESDVHNLYSSLADIFQLNVDDLQDKLYVDDLETQKQAIRDAQDTIQAAIDTALEVLKPLHKKASIVHTDLEEMSQTITAFQGALARDEQGQSDWYQQQAHSLRVKAYCGCIASVVGGPAGLAICYGTAAGVLETYLSDLRKEVSANQKRMQHMGALFGKLGVQCSRLSNQALRDYNSMGEVKDKLITEKHLVKPPTVTFWKSRVLPATKQLVALLRRKASETQVLVASD